MTDKTQPSLPQDLEKLILWFLENEAVHEYFRHSLALHLAEKGEIDKEAIKIMEQGLSQLERKTQAEKAYNHRKAIMLEQVLEADKNHPELSLKEHIVHQAEKSMKKLSEVACRKIDALAAFYNTQRA